MMALNSGTSAEAASGGPARTTTATSVSSKQRGRRRSKGTIAGFAFGAEARDGRQAGTGAGNDGGQNGKETSGGSTNSTVASALSTSGQGTQTALTNDSTTQAPASMCHSARLALLACQNALQLGARTQLGLCPPGRARRNLHAALRHSKNGKAGKGSKQKSATVLALQAGGQGAADGYFSLERMLGAQTFDQLLSGEADFLANTSANALDANSDEEASSGDEDDLTDIDDLLNDNSRSLNDEGKYKVLREPLFTPTGADPSAGANAGTMGAMAPNGLGKLPFNRRKIMFFDSSTASDHAAARTYLSVEARKSKQREVLLLTRYLRRMQREEKQRVKNNLGGRAAAGDSDLSDQENDFQREKNLAATGMSRFEQPMTPAIASALLVESLSMNPVESLEGMAKCYEGIVHAGVAVLEIGHHDTASPLDGQDKMHRERSDIVAVLTILLITSLEQPSGEALLALAQLRRMCGTPRYQRRFVQRIAPSLVRPPRGAVWCLRHQNDMEPILAAVELILDSASQIFSKGWFERGKLMLADSKRAETLNSAATQLRNLGGDPSDGPTLGLTGHGHGHSMRRSNKFGAASSHGRDGSNGPEALAEWEVIALDKQITVSITRIISTDWSSIPQPNELNRSGSYHHRLMKSSSFARRNSSGFASQTSEGSSRGILSTPLSPTRPRTNVTPTTPPALNSYSQMTTTAAAATGSASAQADPAAAATSIPTLARPADMDQQSNPTTSAPFTTSLKQSPSTRPDQITDVQVGVSGGLGQNKIDTVPAPPSQINQFGANTPPRSPRRERTPTSMSSDPLMRPAQNSLGSVSSPTPSRSFENDAKNGLNARGQSASSTYASPASSPSPAANAPSAKGATTPTQTVPSTENERAPLSPSSPHTGTSGPDMASYRPASSASSVASASTMGSQPTNYRMLTSTAAERKRTVAACRALRSQIIRFEEAFMQLHGRPPRGATERAPLASTYAQYREWKKAIRADAACRIVGLVRGFLARRRLFRSNDPAKVRFIATRRERLGQRAMQGQDHVMAQLALPADIGDPGIEMRSMGGSTASITSFGSDSLRYDDDGSVNSSGSGIPRNSSSKRRLPDRPDGFPMSPASRPYSSQPGKPSSPAPGDEDLAQLPLHSLQARKRELKQQLRQYDMAFARRHGRMPVKAEKEPIRHLYETYNTLKSLITTRGQEGPGASSPVAMQQSPSGRMSPQSISPASGKDIGGHEASRMRLRRPKTSPSPVADAIASPPVPMSSPTPTGQDLASLRAEKGRLHQMLRSYERDFYREHNRQVSSFADIRPVASEYRRYKEIKRAIEAVRQESGGSDSDR